MRSLATSALRSLLGVACFLTPLAAPGWAAVRVALVSSRGGSEAENVLALAEVELSGRGDLVLVERREIDRLLAEGQLSLSGLVDAATAIREGKLLGADVLAVVETDPQGSQALGILAFETLSGAHLCDTALAEGDPQQAARQIARAVRAAARKYALGPAGRRTFCLVSVRNADLPLSANALCDGVGRLAERALTNSPDIVVLERKRYDLVKQELAFGQLDPEAAETKLLFAVLTAEIEVRHGSGEELLASAAMATAEGKPLGTVRAKAEYRDALALADALAPQLATLMKAAPAAGLGNRREEAGRFAREAMFWYQNRQMEQAMTSLEAALALDPRSNVVLEAATEILFFAAGETLEPGRFLLPPRRISARPETVAAALGLAERGMNAAETMVRQQAAQGSPPLAHLLEAVPNTDGSLRIREPVAGLLFSELLLERFPLVEEGSTDDSLRRVAALQERYRTLCKAIDERARRAVVDRQSYIRYTNWLSVLVRNTEVFSPTAKAWADDTAAALEAWLTLADRYGPYLNEFFTLNTMIAGVANHSGQLDRVGYPGQWVLASPDAERLSAVFRRMAADREPTIAVLGRAALFTSGVNWRQPLEDEVARDFQELLGRAQAVIRHPGSGDPRTTRVICYYALLDAIEALPAAERRRQFATLLDFMLDRGELVYGAALPVCEPAHSSYSYYAPHLYRTLGRRKRSLVPPAEYQAMAAASQRVLERIDRREAVCLDGQESRLRSELIRGRESLFLLHPELRPKTPPPWRRAVRLLSTADYPGLRAISRVEVRGHTAWTMGLGEAKSPGDKAAGDDEPDSGGGNRSRWYSSFLYRSTPNAGVNPDALPFLSGFLRPIAVDLDTAARRTLPKVGYPRASVSAPVPAYSDNCYFDMDDHTLCIGSFSQGLFLMPLQGGAGEWLEYDGQPPPQRRSPTGGNVIRHFRDVPADERLPSGRVLSLAIQDGKVFASVGAFSRQGSFLVSVRLDNHKVRIISSSRGTEHQSPLGGLEQPPLILLPLVKDLPRHRLLLVVSYPLSHCGLWELDTLTEKIRRRTASRDYIHWVSANRGGRVLLGLANADRSQWYALEYDLAHDRSELVYASLAGAAGGLPPGPRAIVAPAWPAEPPYLRVGGALWTSGPFGAIDRASARGAAFPPLEDKPELLRELVGLDHEFTWRTMEPLDDGRILLSDRHGIWLVTP
jgi:tetratricopeptide (TPR) repeat protein